MNDKRSLLKNFLFYLFVCIISMSISNINLFNNHFVFVVPFIYFCFLNKKRYGIISLVSAFIYLGIVNKWFFLLMLVVVLSLIFVKNILKINNGKMINVLCLYNFIVVLICGIFENIILKENMFILIFLTSVVSYWVMRYFFELYFVSKKKEGMYFDTRLSCFVLVVLGLVFIGSGFSFLFIDLWLIGLLILSYIGVKIGFEVGAVYSLVMFGVLLVYKGVNVDLFLFGSSFLVIFFLAKTSKLTLFFTYIGVVLFVIYYLDLNYLSVVNYCLAALIFVLIPNSFVRSISEICYGSKMYIEKICEDNKKFNLEMANRIVKMEEVFSLVCEKINIKERIRKNDKMLLVEEVQLFSSILESFSKEIKNNYDFNINYRVEKEFYKYGVDLLNFNFDNCLIGGNIVCLSLRCQRKEIDSFVVPLVSKILKQTYIVKSISYNEVFGYYSLKLESRDRTSFEYGVSQKSFDSKACGDSYLVYENKEKYIFAISDGMGTGRNAREISKLALDLFKKFMDIGFSVEQTLKSLNSILVDKYSKDSYSTLDLFIYDKLENKASFCKNGASDSYLINDNIEIIKGNELPIGIIEKREYEFKDIGLNKGDCVIMVSDGVGEINFKNIEKIKNKSSQKISEFIVREENNISDDKTVFVIKIC